MKRLSVIVPTYNFANYIEQSLISIFNQKVNFDFDVIVRDDCSTDDTKYILNRLQRYYDNLIVLSSTENVGGNQNVKLLLDQCRYEYIMYLDGDDYLVNPDKLQLHIDFLDNYPKCSMVSSGYTTISNDGYKPKNSEIWLHPMVDVVTTDDIRQSNCVGFGRVFRNVPNLFKDWMLDSDYLDWMLNYEISKTGWIKNENWFGGVYRQHSSGVFTSKTESERNQSQLKTLQIINRH